jgi:glucosamine-6-phosphate deaminase
LTFAGYSTSQRVCQQQSLGNRSKTVDFDFPSTRLKALSKDTIEDNRKFFAPGEEIPQCAITMGIGTILEAKRILLLATGSSKAAPIAAAIEGPVSASALQLHPDVTFIVDQQAGAQLKQQEYYRRVLEMTALLTPDRL